MNEDISRALTDEEAMSRLLLELEPFVFRVAFYLTRHQQDAEDLAQEVLYKICTKLRLFRGESTFQTWVYTLVMNTFRDMQRKRRSDVQEDVAERAQEGSFEETSHTRMLLGELLEQLQEVDRNIVILRYQNDLPIRDVAEILKLSESNVKIRVFRLRDRLRNLFLAGGGDQ